MDPHLKDYIEYLLCINIESVRSVSGGDISKAYRLETESERFFCKVNHADQAHDMFLAEKNALDAIAQTKSIAAPKILFCEPLVNGSVLLMKYIESKRASSDEMAQFGHQLAALHHFSVGDNFGWKTDNFIGSLPQSNTNHTDWSRFYVCERLLPQLQRAQEGNRLHPHEIPSEEELLGTCKNLFPVVSPSLLHGDLWSGNYLISRTGVPYLIDPATYYGHREVDIAMTRLFGGFGTPFYDAYNEHFPKVGGEKERIDLYQLYYLLVHLNLFGSSYKASVTEILDRYF